nr:hypothetical protein [Anaerocolumna sedimenticola]
MNYYDDTKRKRRRKEILFAKLYCILLFGMLVLAILVTLLLTNYKGENLTKLPNTISKGLDYLESGHGIENKYETNSKENQYQTQETQNLAKQDKSQDFNRVTGYDNGQNVNTVRKADLSLDVENLYSPEAILLERKNGNIIADNNGDKKIYPASMTKIMTAILAIENIPDLNEKLKIPSDIYQDLYAEGASLAGFEPGEAATAKDLIYGILLPSGQSAV